MNHRLGAKSTRRPLKTTGFRFLTQESIFKQTILTLLCHFKLNNQYNRHKYNVNEKISTSPTIFYIYRLGKEQLPKRFAQAQDKKRFLKQK